MAGDVREALLEEIALEGLDGITVNSLWIRLSESENFSLSLDEQTKCYLWNCVLTLKDVEFYELSKPRPDLVSYNRFHYVDPETKHFLETEDIPDDIYPINLINEDGIMGSCVEYKTRANVSQHIRAQKLGLNAVIEQYGNKLVIVASQAVRQRALIGVANDPSFEFSDIMYSMLERIGRSRSNGEATIGKMSLQVFKQTSKTLFYIIKKLKKLNVLKKQRLCTIKKPSNQKLSCFLYHLSHFFREVGSRSKHELMIVAKYLSEKKEQMEVVAKVRSDLKIYDSFKRITRLHASDGERIFIHVDVPYRELYPNAAIKDYMTKNGIDERMIRHIKMRKSLDEIREGVVKGTVESSDEEEEDTVDDSTPNIEFVEVFDEPQLYQVLQVIKKSGSRGLSQVELRKILNMNRLAVRRVVNLLDRLHYVKTVMQDRGRQKTEMFVVKNRVEENKIHKSVLQQIRNITDSPIHPDTINTPKHRLERKTGIPSITFKDEVPSEEKVDEIKQELFKLEDQPSVAKLAPVHIDQISELRGDSMVKVEIKEVYSDKTVDPTNKNQQFGMRRFSCLTENHVRRANWIIEVVGAIKVVENFKLLKLLRNREKEMHLEHSMDGKSLKRLVMALIEENRLRSYKANIAMHTKSREIAYLCDPSIHLQHETLKRMIEEAKLRHFSLSKEELIKRKKLNAAQLKEMKDGVKPKKEDQLNKNDIPDTAKKSIRKHQEYRRKLVMELPTMKYDRSAGVKYGLLPKMLRLQTVHQYLFHLCYETYGDSVKTVTSVTTNQPVKIEREDAVAGPSSSVDTKIDIVVRTDIVEGNEDKLDVKEFNESDAVWKEKEPPMYFDELSWRRYLPPIPVHAGYPKGWCLISDVLLILPVYLFCRIVNVSYDIDGLLEILDHPTRRFYPVIHLPFEISQQLLHSKKYVQAFMESSGLLAEMGVLSFGREVLKDKEQTFVFLHQNLTLLDTRSSLPGYNKTRFPDDNPFPEKTFHMEKLQDLLEFWEFLQIVTLSSNLGHKSFVHEDLEDGVSFEIKSVKMATNPNDPSSIMDIGVIPGDRRGGAGFDSSLFVHTMKNWTYRSMTGIRRAYPGKQTYMGLAGGLVLEESKRKIVGCLKGKNRMTLTENLEKPLVMKKVRRENQAGNKGGRAIKRMPRTLLTTKTHKRIKEREGIVLKRRKIKILPRKQQKKRPFEKGDATDREIYKKRKKQRVFWSKKEDSTILMCRLATLIMDNRRKTSVVLYTQIRDYLHGKCGPMSHDKSSFAVQRRLIFVMRNPQTEANLLLYYREAMQDEFVLKNFVSKEFLLTDENTMVQFRRLVDFLLDKFKSLDLQKCALPESLEELADNYTIQYIGKLTLQKQFHDPKNKADICHDVLRNILHCAVLLMDKHGRQHEMFKLLTQYPDILLCNVTKELRGDGLLVINKKVYLEETMSQLHSGLGLRNFKVSQKYMNCFTKYKYMSTMFGNCAQTFEELCTGFVQDEGDEQGITLPFRITSGHMSVMFPMMLKGQLDVKIRMPDDLVVVDMENFYNFPWGRGKNVGFSTKADKSLQDIQQYKSRIGGKTPASPAGRSLLQPPVSEDLQGEITVTVNPSGELSISKPGDNTDSSVTNAEDSPMIGDHSYINTGGDDTMNTTGANISHGSSVVTLSRTEDDIVLEVKNGQAELVTKNPLNPELPKKSKQHSITSTEKTAESEEAERPTKKMPRKKDAYANVKVTESKSKSLVMKPSMSEKLIQTQNKVTMEETSQEKLKAESIIDAEETFTVKAKDFTKVTTKHSQIVIPKAEMEEYNMDGQSSALASRTLLSLRRAEDCSFDEIRVFNAQDNFVVKSCEIQLKIRSPGEEKISDNFLKVTNRGPPSDLDYSNVNRTSPKGQPFTSSSKDGKNIEMNFGAEDGDSVEDRVTLDQNQKHSYMKQLKFDKNKVKEILTKLQQILPFQLDMVRVWEDFDKLDVTADMKVMCKQVFDIVDTHGELGIRWIDLRKTFCNVHRLVEALDILQHHSIVVKVGVTCTRYVSLNNARPWVVHAYRNIRGRGLHVDEASSNTKPIEEDDFMTTREEDNVVETEEGAESLLDVPKEDKIVLANDVAIATPKQEIFIADVPGDKHLSSATKRPKTSDNTSDRRNEMGSNTALTQGRTEVATAETVEGLRLIENETAAGLRLMEADGVAGAKKRKIGSSELGEEYSPSINMGDGDNQITASDSPDKKRRKCSEDRLEDDSSHDRNVSGQKEADNTNDTPTDKEGSTEKESTAVESTAVDECNKKTDNQSTGTQTRVLRKRKHPDFDAGSADMEPQAVSTYDKVRLLIQPWRKPEGGVNKPIFKMIIESVMLFIMIKPGTSLESLVKRYTPYLQPMMITYLLDILEEIGCITRVFMKKSKPSLFSKPVFHSQDPYESEDSTILIIPEVDCVLKLGQFGHQMYPDIVWPESSYLTSQKGPLS